MQDKIHYSEKYQDNYYEYRMVTMPRVLMSSYHKTHGFREHLEEKEWRKLGVKQSRGWFNYGFH